MPHLSPMNWLLMPILFWMMLIITMTMFWWLQSPKLPHQPTFTAPYKPIKWAWSK